ncbi:MAG: TRAP transporter substrate-binding protein [Clostridia bacterium]|nr:TRAP transporter substrate-binding protein [Clostridia bacterium]
MMKNYSILKKIVFWFLLISFLFIMVGCGGGSKQSGQGAVEGESEEKIIIKYGHDHLVDSHYDKGAHKFKELVEAKTEGKVEVQIYPSHQLGSAREMIEGAQVGNIEVIQLPSAKFGGFDQRLTIVDLPFLFPNYDMVWEVLDGPLGRELLDGLGEVGLKGVAWCADDFKQFTNIKEIRKPDDFKGQKIRVMEAPVIMEQFKAWGANPVPIDFAEVYNSLQQKVVDGQENPIQTIMDMKFYEVQEYVIISDHGYLPYVLVFSKVWYDKLDPDLQKILWDAGIEAAEYQKGPALQAREDSLKRLEQEGRNKIIYLTDEEKQAFAEASKPVYEKFKEQIGADLVDRFLQFIEENK